MHACGHAFGFDLLLKKFVCVVSMLYIYGHLKRLWDSYGSVNETLSVGILL